MKQSQGWLSKAGMPALVLSFIVLALFGLRTVSNADFWLHLASGRSIAASGISRVDTFSFTAAGKPWINVSWLYDWLIHGMWTIGGSPLIIFAHVAAVVVAFACLVSVARKWAGELALALALLLSAWLLAPRFVVGPQLVGLLLTAAFVTILSSERLRFGARLALLLPLQILWANVDASFIFGPFVCAVFVADTWWRKRLQPDAVREVGFSAVLALAAGMVAIVNPYGLSAYSAVWKGGAGLLREWISPFSGMFTGSLYLKALVPVALIVCGLGLVAERRRLPTALTVLAAVSAFFVVRSQARFAAFFSVAAFPFLALSLSAIGSWLEEKLQTVSRSVSATAGKGVAMGTAAIAILSIITITTNGYYVSTGSASTFGFGLQQDMFPSAAEKVISRPDFPRNAVNVASDGGYLLWRFPYRTVFMDQRFDVYGDLLQSLNTVFAPETAASALSERWDAHAVILNCVIPGSCGMARNLLTTGQWGLAYFDGGTAILLQKTSENEALLQSKEIQEAGLGMLDEERQRYAARIGRIPRPGVSPRLIGAGNFYMSMGRYEDAASIYGLLTKGACPMVGAWVNLGIARLNLGETDAAVAALERAVDLAPKSGLSWLYLSKAYTAAGQTREAELAQEKGQKFDPVAAAALIAP